MAFSDFQLTVKQKRIYDGLKGIDENIAKAYIGAYLVLFDPANPDRFSQSAHSFREVTSMLSRVKATPQNSIVTTENEGEVVEKKNMVEKLRKRLSLEDGYILPAVQQDIGSQLKQWEKIQRFLIAVAHHGKQINWNLTEEEFLLKISELEDLLEYFVGPPNLTLSEIDVFIEINEPDENDVRCLLKKIAASPIYVEYFFSKVTSDGWLGPLKEKGVFKVPQGKITDGGAIFFPIWWPSRYLQRMAQKHQKFIMDIIQSMKNTDNFRVHVDLIEASLEMNAPEAKRILPLVSGWIKTDVSDLTTMKAQELCIKFIKENEKESAIHLLRSFMELGNCSHKPESEDVRGSRNQMDIWHLEQVAKDIIPLLLRKCPSETIDLLCKTLFNCINKEEKTGFIKDYSPIWRSAIEDNEQDLKFVDFEDVLISQIRNCLEAMGKEEYQAFNRKVHDLDRYPATIFIRLKIHTFRIFPSLFEDEICEIVTNIEILQNSDYWHELYHILEEQFIHLPSPIKERYYEIIRDGLDSSYVSKRCREISNENGIRDEIEWLYNNFKQRLLTPIKDNLPQDLEELLRDLERKCGISEHPDYPSGFVSSNFEGDSKKNIMDLQSCSCDEIIEHYRDESRKGVNFRDYLDDALEDAVFANVNKFIDYKLNLDTIPIPYVVHVLQGLINALKKGIYIDWQKVLQFLDELIVYDWKITHTKVEPLYSIDSIYYAVLHVFDQFLIKCSDENLKDKAWNITVTLIEKCVLSTYQEDHSWRDDEDFIIHAINDNEGMATDSLISYIIWLSRISETDFKKEIDTEARKILEELLRNTITKPSIVRTVIGIRLVNLYAVIPDWTRKNFEVIFPVSSEDRKAWKMSWEGYVIANRFYSTIYNDLKNQYLTAINKIEGLSEEAKTKTIHHLIQAFIFGKEALDASQLKILANRSTSKIRGFIIKDMGNILSYVNKIDRPENEVIISKCCQYWEWRLQEIKPGGDSKIDSIIDELVEIDGIFISIPKINQYDLQRLSRTLNLTKGKVRRPKDVIEKLRDCVKIDDKTTIIVVISILRADYPVWEKDYWRKDLHILLEALRSSEDLFVLENIKVAANISVQHGFFEFKDNYDSQ